MWFTRPRIYLCLALLLALPIAGYLGRQAYWHSHPEAAFASITGRTLPVGVDALAYRREMADSFFHPTHYWLLSGNPDSLYQVIAGTGFERSDEDARWMVPDLAELFGSSLSKSQVVAGYEWELPRNRWYVIFEGEANALYTH
jgi:hypothetical protein